MPKSTHVKLTSHSFVSGFSGVPGTVLEVSEKNVGVATAIVEQRKGAVWCDADGVFVSDYATTSIYDISAGGDFTSATPFVSNLRTQTLQRDEAGKLWAAHNQGASQGLYDISAGGDAATLTPFFGGNGLVSKRPSSSVRN